MFAGLSAGSKHEAKAIALDGPKNRGGGRAGGQGTSARGWFPVLESRCCISGAGDGPGELFNHNVSLGEGRGTTSPLPDAPAHHRGLPNRTSHVSPRLPQISCPRSRQNPQPICLHPTLYPHCLRWGSFPLPGGMWELGFFNRSCRYSSTAPRVLCEATKQEARSLAAHTEQSFLQRSDCRISDAFSCRVSTREVRLTEPYNHLVKVRPGPSYSVVTHWLSFSLHLGVSKVAQAPDLPWGVLVTVSPQTLGAESWTLQKNITQSSRARRSRPRLQLRCRVLHFWWFGLASCQLTPATGTAGVELLRTAEQSPAGRSETATKGKPKGSYKANRERLCF